MANNDYITTDCKLTISKDTAKLDEELFLYKNDKNIKLLIEIVDKKYRYKTDTPANLLTKYKASYAQVKWYKNAEVKKEFPIQATDDGKVVFIIEEELINEDTELGDYDLQLRLLNESQESIRSLPIIKGAVHILKPLFEEGDIATVNSAVADIAKLSIDGDTIDTYNSDGTYNQTNWVKGDIIASAKLNKLEKVAKDNVDKVNKIPAIKADIQTLKANEVNLVEDETSMEGIKDNEYPTLTTTDKTLIGSINEVNGQCKENNAEVVQARGSYKLLNDRLNAMNIDKVKVGFDKMDRPLRSILNEDLFTVNFHDLKVYVNHDMNYIVGINSFERFTDTNKKLDNIDIPEDAINDLVYTQYTFWYDKTNKILKFTPSNKCPKDNSVVFGFFYHGKPFLPNDGGIKVIDKNGNNVITAFKQIGTPFVPHAIFYSNGNNPNGATMLINIDNDKYTITATTKKGRWIIFENGGVETKEDKSFTIQCTAQSVSYSYKLFISRVDGTPLIKKHNEELTNSEASNYVFVCLFDNRYLYSPTFTAGCVLINGKVPTIMNQQTSTSNYDWENNRFVLPSDWYLVKDIPYTIAATDFNMQQLTDNDDCLFEITLPTKVVQFEQTADISIPYSYDHPFKTRLSGKCKGYNTLLTQDINLHVADPSKITKKDIKVLCIGDSITQSNYPKHLKWHLAQMGINATMLGTVVDSHEGYSYGISQYLEAEKGEGRGGWRLTDFTCTTPLKSGGYYVDSSFPMRNPTTGAFDFSYYMQQQKFSDVDFVIINLGTNDIGGYHYAGSVTTDPAYNTIRRVDLDGEYLNAESEYYLGKLYRKLIDSIHTYNSNIKIAINPPMGAGDSAFIVSSMKWAEICQYEFKDVANVYNLASYMAQAQLSATNIEGNKKDFVQVYTKNETYRCNYTPNDVHYNGMGQLIHTLYPASWIVNMCL